MIALRFHTRFGVKKKRAAINMNAEASYETFRTEPRSLADSSYGE